MSESVLALPKGHPLLEYRIESVLGVGGFGVTYLATDANLNLKVAVKEYLPGEFAGRNADSSVEPKPDSQESFHWGLQRFMDEARTLASFRHPNIVRVMRFFEANATGYMVMEFVEGRSLVDWIATRRPLGRDALSGMMLALLDGLEVIHNAGFLHRDIKPANIFIRNDGSPVLLDFGSARELGVGNRELTAIVTPGYAPLEQYHAHGKQGPWSDLYAFGGVMYWMVTGKKPVEAAARVRQDVLPAARDIGDCGIYGEQLLTAIDWALKPNEDERPQNVAAFRGALTGNTDATRTVPVGRDAERTLVLPRGATAPAAEISGLTGMALDRDLLKQVEAALAVHIGPIAAVVIRRAAASSATIEMLCETVGREIPDEKARALFVKQFARQSDSQPVSGRTGLAQTPTAEALQSISQKFTPELLTRAEKEMAQHIGAIARVVVKRAAAKARDVTELYLLIADEIKDPAEKKAFIRKAVTSAGK